jgi:protein-tyrosine phosphatase
MFGFSRRTAEAHLAEENRIIKLEGGINFRDMGGYALEDGRRIRWRCLFRSGTTDALTAADRESLATLRIRSAVDLRSNHERAEFPHGLAEDSGVHYQTFDHDRIGGDLIKMLEHPRLQPKHMHFAMMRLYSELPYEFGDIYQELFRALVHGSLPLVFNCAAGKDRTGVAAALVLVAVGVPWEDVAADYMISEQFVADVVRKFSASAMGGRLARIDKEIAAPIFEVRCEYLETMRDSIIERSGSMANYLRRELRLDSEMLQALRQRLIG